MTTERDKRLQPLVAWFVFAFLCVSLGNSLVVKLVMQRYQTSVVTARLHSHAPVALLVMID
ncbi:hypothetical protein Plhal703r1_c15g0073161 [Plasmopara halstedii]